MFFDYVCTLLHSNRVTVLGGDFNCVEDLGLDKAGGAALAGALGSVPLLGIRRDFELVDAFRHVYPAGREYTFSAQGVSTRLDRFYISRGLLSAVHAVAHVHCPYSDHSLVQLHFGRSVFSAYDCGPGYWKCNVSVLGDSALRSDFLEVWISCVSPLLSRMVPGGTGVKIAFGPCCVPIRFAWLGSGRAGSGTSWGG